jgi:hypothetical protein
MLWRQNYQYSKSLTGEAPPKAELVRDFYFMAKELPYFKFEPGAWDNGNIQICSYKAQGVFINICCLYWQRLGDLPERLILVKICKGDIEPYKELIDHGIIKSKDGKIEIDFLDSQLEEFSDLRQKRVEAGSKGGKNRSLSPEIARVQGSQFYVIHCYNDDEEFIKVGVTSESISRRFSGKMPYKYDIIFQLLTDDYLSIESECCDKLRQYSYVAKEIFPGYLECFKTACIDDLSDIMKRRNSFALATPKLRNAIREENRREEEKKTHLIKPYDRSDYYNDPAQAFDDIKADELFVERLVRIMHQRGFRSFTPVQMLHALREFLTTEAAKPEFPDRERVEVKSHFTNWISKYSEKVANTHGRI